MSYRLQTAALSTTPEYFSSTGDETSGLKPAIGGPPPPTRFFKCIFCFIAIVFVLFVIVVIAFVIFLHPLYPVFNANYIHISNFSHTEKSLSGTFEVGFEAYNPNRVLKLGYQKVHGYVFYKTNFIGSGHVSDFMQDVKDSRLVSTTIKVHEAHLTAHKINDIIFETTNRGHISFNTELKAEMKDIYPWESNGLKNVTAKCDSMAVVMAGPNNSSGTTAKDHPLRGCRLMFPSDD